MNKHPRLIAITLAVFAIGTLVSCGKSRSNEFSVSTVVAVVDTDTIIAGDALRVEEIHEVFRDNRRAFHVATLTGAPGSTEWRTGLIDTALEAGSSSIIVYPAVEGTAIAFSDARLRGTKARLIAVAPMDSPIAIQESADLALGIDISGIARQATIAAIRFSAQGIVAVASRGPKDFTEITELEAQASKAGIPFELLKVDSSAESVRAIKAVAKAGITICCLDQSLSTICIEALTGTKATYVGWLSPAALGAKDLRGLEEAMLARGFAGKSAAWPVDGNKALLIAAVTLVSRFTHGLALSEKDVTQVITAAFSDEGTSGGAYRESIVGARSMNHFVVLPRLYAFGEGYLPIK